MTRATERCTLGLPNCTAVVVSKACNNGKILHACMTHAPFLGGWVEFENDEPRRIAAANAGQPVWSPLRASDKK